MSPTDRDQILKAWLAKREEEKRLLSRIEEIRLTLKGLEDQAPWLGNIKGILKKGVPQSEEAGSIRGKEGSSRKRSGDTTDSGQLVHSTSGEQRSKEGPLMKKSRREAEKEQEQHRRGSKKFSSPGPRTHIRSVSEMSEKELEKRRSNRGSRSSLHPQTSMELEDENSKSDL